MGARWLSILLLLVLLAALTVAVQTQMTAGLELGANALFAPYRPAWLLDAFVWLTAMGTGASLTGTALAATALLWASGRGRSVFPLWVTFLGAEAATWSLKFVFDRPRPTFLPGVATATSPSYPSAHATATAALIGILAYIVAADRPARGERFGVAAAAMALIALIGFSRVYLSVHYLSDVLAGFLIAAIWLLIGTMLADRRSSRRRQSPEPDALASLRASGTQTTQSQLPCGSSGDMASRSSAS